MLVERRKLLIRPIRSFGVFHKLLIVLGVLRVGQPALDRDLGVVLRLRQQQVFVLDDVASAGIERAVCFTVGRHRVIAGIVVGVDALDVLDLAERRIAERAVRVLDDLVERAEILGDVVLVGVFAADGVPVELLRGDFRHECLRVVDLLLRQRLDRKRQDRLAKHLAGRALAVDLHTLADLHLDLRFDCGLSGQRTVDNDMITIHLRCIGRQTLELLHLTVVVVEDAGVRHLVEIRKQQIVLDRLRQVDLRAVVIVVGHKTGEFILEILRQHILRIFCLGLYRNTERVLELERADIVAAAAHHGRDRVRVKVFVEQRDHPQLERCGRFAL